MEKIVKARKNWECDSCEGSINIGEMCLLGRGREPRDDDGYYEQKQIGIWYYEYRICMGCLNRANEN